MSQIPHLKAKLEGVVYVQNQVERSANGLSDRDVIRICREQLESEIRVAERMEKLAQEKVSA